MKTFYNKKMTSSAVSLLLVTSSVISANALEVIEEGSIENADSINTEGRSSTIERSSVSTGIHSVTTSNLNVRKGPGTSYGIVGQLNEGQLVTVSKVSNGWAQITYGNSSSAYCSYKYLTKVNRVGEITESVYLRKSYSWDSAQVMLMKKGTKVEVIAIGKYWAKVKCNGTIGYVAKKYVSENGVSSSTNSTSSSTSSTVDTVQITAATYLRATASWSANKLVLLEKNAKAELVSKGAEWSKLKYNGKTGYVANDYFKQVTTSSSTGGSTSSSAGSSTSGSTSEQTKTKEVQITAATYLRATASWSANKLVLLEKNAKAELVSKGAEWSKLKYNGKTGYVANDYFKEVTSSSSTGQENGTITEATYLRATASWSANKLVLLEKNAKVKAISKDKDWTKVEYNGKTGYVANDFIKVSGTISSNEEAKTTKYVVNTTSLNVRSGAGTSYSKIGSVKEGQVVEVYSITSGWARIKFNNGVGYVSASYIDKQGTTTSGSSTSNSKTLIYLDAGHGGKDPGAIGTTYSTKEKDAVLDVSNRVYNKLKAKGYSVKYSRNTDVYIPLLERTNGANQVGANLFVSFHFNSATTSAAAGIETLYKVDGRSSDVLANKIQNSMVNAIDMKNRGLKTRSDLSVLNNSKMPAVLIEGGFLSNSSDENAIKSSSFRETLANAVVKGIEEYLKVSK